MGYSTSKATKKNTDIADEAYGVVGSFLGITFGWSAASVYKNFYEIRSNWHRVPSIFRIPIVGGLIGFFFVIQRALTYLLRRIFPKKTP